MNSRVKKPMGKMLFDEKMMGTIHVATGANHTWPIPDKFKIVSGIHCDFVIMKPNVDVYWNGKNESVRLMENGKFVVKKVPAI